MSRRRLIPRVVTAVATGIDLAAWIVLFATSDSRWLWICWVAIVVGIAGAATGAVDDQPRLAAWSVFVVVTALLLVLMVGLSA